MNAVRREGVLLSGVRLQIRRSRALAQSKAEVLSTFRISGFGRLTLLGVGQQRVESGLPEPEFDLGRRHGELGGVNDVSGHVVPASDPEPLFLPSIVRMSSPCVMTPTLSVLCAWAGMLVPAG